jgi:beta-lactamase class A
MIKFRTVVGTCITLTLLVGALLYSTHFVEAHAADERALALQHQKEIVAAADFSRATSSLDTIINTNSDLDISVAMIDLDTGKMYHAGSNNSFTAASTTKLLTAADYFHKVELGKASLSQYIEGDTAQDLLERMVRNSDNNAWVALNDYLTYQQMSSYAKSLGITSYDWENNTITATDEAKLLQQIYDGNVVSSANRSLLYSYMQNTSDDDLIPDGVPSSATVYHKYGDFNGNLHDAAIVNYDDHNFALVIYTNNPNDDTLDDYSSRVDLFHQLTAVTSQL